MTDLRLCIWSCRLCGQLKARTTVIGGLNPDYPGDQWHHGLSELVVTCRAYGLRAIDGPFGDFNDPDAYIDAQKSVQ